MCKRESFRFILFLIIFLSFYESSFAQHYSVQEKLKWQIITNNSNPNQDEAKILSFVGCNLFEEPSNMAVYYKNIPISKPGKVLWELKEADFSPAEPLENLSAFALKSEIHIKTEIVYSAHQAYLNISFIPFRKNSAGQIEKLDQFNLDIHIEEEQTEGAVLGSRDFKKAESSKLASGNWYKIGLTETGVYKLDYNFLNNAGVNMSNLKASHIQIYGKAGGMLPQANSIARDDDMVENAIFLADVNGNDIFDKEDYVAFYAVGPHVWKYNAPLNEYEHTFNIYTDTIYYYLTVGEDAGKRVGTELPPSGAVDNVITGYDDYAFHEMDQLTDITKFVRSGREWFGEEFKTLSGSTVTKSFPFSFPNIDVTEKAKIKTYVLARSSAASKFDLSINGKQLTTLNIKSTEGNELDAYAQFNIENNEFQPDNAKMNVQLTYYRTATDAIGWLNYIEVKVRSNLKFTNGQYAFRDVRSVQQGKINEYRISSVKNKVAVWDVTDFHNVKAQTLEFKDNVLSFKSTASILKEFVVFDENSFFTPKFYGVIPNQDLHGSDQPDMVIVVHPMFMEQAQRLAEFHRIQDHFIMQVVTPQQVYNEFSYGAQDVTAIRDFMKMYYDRAADYNGKYPKYLLLFGDASYDFKNRVDNNTNFVPSYQGFNSLAPESSFMADNYFAFLDDNEGWTSDAGTSGMLDLSVGRIPVGTAQQAEDVVNKILHYHEKECLGDWRNVLSFIADDPDVDGNISNIHFDQTEGLANMLSKGNPSWNIQKFYLDAYKQESTPAGQRYPDVNKAINLQMNQGTLILNYVGHGAPSGMAHEKVVTFEDVNSWHNYDKLSLIITATCELSRFDDPARTSIGEQMVLSNKGGAIAMFSTTRVVYSGLNNILNKNMLLNNLLQKTNGLPKTFGEGMMMAQNLTGDNINTRCFSLLGDPAIRIALPKDEIIVTEINGNSSQTYDTLRALQLVTIKGEVRTDGTKNTSFDGTIYPTIYDKANIRYTLANEGVFKSTFTVQDNIIYKGKVSVKEGAFSFSFYMPKDISFIYGKGKISLYADNGKSDAAGYDTAIIGGVVSNPIVDNEGPIIKLYMNDTNFVNGGMVNNNPYLIAKLWDDIGINTIGSGVGHNIEATLNNSENFILDKYYTTDLDDYKSGTVVYPFYNLHDGNYSLKLKAWDVSNNSSEAFIDFVVASSTKLAIDKIINYPNPFRESTTFAFDYNRPNEELDVNIQIFNLAGQLVKEIKSRLVTEGSHVQSITWDGKDDSHNKLGSGMYIYRIIIKTNDGQVANQSERLVIIK